MDPFLRAHREDFHVFDLGDRAPISIRDQILRAHYLVDRLRADGALVPKTNVLVVGAGAAGVTAAIELGRMGVSVDLIDRKPSPFSTQYDCASRWIDPVQYDWPLRHAEEARWPATTTSARHIPMAFQAGRADQVAMTWENTLSIERGKAWRHLRTRFSVELVEDDPRQFEVHLGRVRVFLKYLKRGDRIVPREYNFAILTCGPGEEDTTVSDIAGAPSFTGLRFWDTDKFEDADFGLPGTHDGIILVSGSGDGGLQDFVRLVTGRRSALEFMREVFDALPPGNQLRARIEHEIGDAEQQAMRAWQWNGRARDDHAFLDALHGTHLDVLRRWRIEDASGWNAAMLHLESVVPIQRARRVKLVHGCTHFSTAYALNRFAVLLLSAYVEHRLGMASPLIPGKQVVGVAPAPGTHTCGPGCWTPGHVAALAPRPDCRSSAGGTRIALPADVLVVRHGLQDRHALKRQLLPFHLP